MNKSSPGARPPIHPAIALALPLAFGLVLPAVTLLPLPALAQTEAAGLRALADQARYWEQREQFGRAREAWQRVVEADPGNVEALSRMVSLSVRLGEAATARRWLDELRKVAPNAPETREAEALASTGAAKRASELNPDTDALTRARAAAARQDYATALKAYREAFGGEPKSGPNALEYYQTLGATDDGWAPAERWLRDAAGKRPDDAAVQLAFAQHLTYRERSRREGIDRLQALADDATVGASARRAWRQALIWLDGKPADAGRYQAWLGSQDAEDAEIRDKLAGLDDVRRAAANAAYGARVKELFSVAEDGNLAKAEAGFADLLKSSPNNADALGGMGIVRLQQQRWDEAINYLDRAAAASPATAARWRDARTTAMFWSNVESGESARAEGDYALAARRYGDAFAKPPADVPDAVRLSYADVLLNTGRDAEAEKIARDVLSRNPEQPEALGVLVTTLSRSGRDAEALALARKAPAKAKVQVEAVRGEQLRRRAEALRKAGDLTGAERVLDAALVEQPTNPWIRLDLAETYRKQGRREAAAVLLDGLLQTHGRNRDVQMARAYFDSELGDWAAVLNRLEALPAADRTDAAIDLQRQAWVQYQVERARMALKRGRGGEAHRIMTETDVAADGDPALLAPLATGWGELQDSARAVAYMRQAVGDGSEAAQSASLRIQYAAVLLTAKQDAEFEIVAGELAARSDLTDAERRSLDGLVIGYRVKLADRAREQRRFPDAYVQLRDVVARYPANPDVQTALARLLSAAGDHAAAANIYRSLAEREPDNLELRLGLVDALLAADNRVEARREIDRGLSIDEGDPRWWKAAARLAEQEGQRGAALSAYRTVEAIERENPSERPEPVLASIDPTEPTYALPTAVASIYQATSPDAPGAALLPRATGVAVPPAIAAAGKPAAVTTTAGGMPLRPSSRLADRSDGSALEGGSSQPLWLKLMDRPGPKAKVDPGAYPRSPTAVARLESATSGWIGGETAIRSRKGEAGLSQLFDLELPVTLVLPETSFGQASVTVTPVYLDAGTASGVRLLRVGTQALTLGLGDTGPRDAGGVAFALGYKLGDFKADVGITPVGFEVQRLVGGVSWRISPGEWRLGADVARRPVGESLLSYAGTFDPLLGKRYGGVSRTGGRLDVAWDGDALGVYGYGGFYTYDADNVETNGSFVGGAGAFGRYAFAANHGLTYGISLTALGFDDNRRFYTFGHGGYFSPQIFTSVALPVQWSGVSGGLSWNLSAAAGVQSFREDGAALHPGFDDLQAEVERTAELNPDIEIQTGYAGQRRTGLGYNARAVTEYRFAPRLTVGGLFSIDNARNFRELQAHGYLRWYFTAQPPEATDPAPIAPFYQY